MPWNTRDRSMAPGKDPVTFPEAVFNQLVDRNFKSALSPEEFPEGWSKQKIDPMDLLSRYRHLNIRKGYTLRGLQYRSGHNGNGFVFAMREDAPFPDPPEFDFTGQDCLIPRTPREPIPNS